ncbi:amino acid deaminase [Cellulomonas triticagri]|uniref:Amino acid deaminase n=1 Tax=Cellulomonas triticagri TaxID=2483352 RepID=A0A3M2JJW2_9CELL|nr:amino acid deaminase [Cellulomonas triticagri]RMI13404.1 amino acid deaminase [Cellulomonas triticagri]
METYKGVPLGATPADVAAWPLDRPALAGMPTPLVTLSEAAVAHNVATMAAWCAAAGVDLAPHGKTTMSRVLWEQQLAAGAWGITVATPWQASVALGWGVPRVQLANALVQPAALRALAPDVGRLLVWSDSVRGVRIMHDALTAAGATEPLGVLVELGAPGGRTGARTRSAALDVARAVADSPVLRLAGVAGYEGALAHDAGPASLETVRGYLADLGALHDALGDLYPDDGEVVVTAGGSAYFDAVADVLATRHDPAGERGRPTRVLLRSGAYVVHDDGFYRGISPLSRGAGTPLRAALHGWATVVSRPEPDLVLLDAGKRDLAYDEGLPEAQGVRRFGESALEPLPGARVTAMNDQHTFLSVPADAAVDVGDVVRLGLSHPCTTFDKWRGIVTVDDDRSPDPRVTGLVETAFG